MDFHWLKVKFRHIYKILLIVHNCLQGKAPEEIVGMIGYGDSFRTMKLQETNYHNKYGSRAFSHVGPKLWNLLPKEIRVIAETTKFKKDLKSFLMLRGEEFCTWANRQWKTADTPLIRPQFLTLGIPSSPMITHSSITPKTHQITPTLLAKISWCAGRRSGCVVEVDRQRKSLDGGHWVLRMSTRTELRLLFFFISLFLIVTRQSRVPPCVVPWCSVETLLSLLLLLTKRTPVKY